MIEFLKGWVVNIVTLVMFIVLAEILVPSGKIKKFVDLVSGFILIIAIVNPVIGLLHRNVDLKEFQIADGNFIDKKEIEANSRFLKEQHMKQIAELYRQKLIRRLEESARDMEGIVDVKADVLIDEDYKSPNFGEIKRVYLNLRLGEKEGGIKAVARVEKVEIGSDKRDRKENREADDEIKELVEGRISKLFGIQRENVVISLQKG